MNTRETELTVWNFLRNKDWAGIWSLIEQGALDPNKRLSGDPPEFKYSLLTLLAGNEGADELILKLIGRGGDVNALQDGNTPLMYAVNMDNDQVADALIAAGADVNFKGLDEPGEGNTALMMAAENGNTWAVTRLLAAGADVHMKTRRKETALYWAAAAGHIEVVRTLAAAGSPLHGNELHWPVLKRHVEMVRTLLELGCDPNGRFLHSEAREGLAKGDTPLMVAASDFADVPSCQPGVVGRRLEITKLLLAAGANPNVGNAKGQTPLGHAVRQRELNYAKLLLAAGADPDFCPPKEKGAALSARAIAQEKGLAKFLELFESNRK